MQDIDTNSLLEKGFVEDNGICSKYEGKFSSISLSAFVLLFSPVINIWLNNDTLRNVYWFVCVPLGLFLLIAVIALVHKGAPVSPVTGKKMKHYRQCRHIKTRYEDYVETQDVWVCHEGKIFCKRLFMQSGDFI